MRCALTTPAAATSSPPPRALVRDLFLRLLGLVFLAAFLSLLAQVTLLVGEHGLLPVREYLRGPLRFLDAPTIFWVGSGDTALTAGAVAGAVLSIALAVGFAPRWCLAALWGLYLSFVTIGQDFLSFQWDNLLLESAFLAFFIAPGGLRPRAAAPPHPLAVFLMLWLVFRLHVESGAAKLLLGDPTWQDLTALVTYYETAPLPTWIGWYAHQMPLWGHKLSAFYMYMVELGLPLFLWGPPTARVVAFVGMLMMQVGVLLTGNYGFFNYLSIALLLFVLDDRQVSRVLGRFATAPAATTARPPSRMLLVAAPILVALSVVQFAPFLPPLRGLDRTLFPLRRMLNTYRSVNAYHLFAHMTLVRREAVIEGSADGVTWETYEFRYKPGDVDRAPPFVAPHQPRVDFQLWFLLLGGRPGARYFDTLLARLLSEPAVVRPLFARDPFPDAPPKLVRVAIYRYRFTDFTARRATGAWWWRELEGYTRPLGADPSVGRAPSSAPRS